MSKEEIAMQLTLKAIEKSLIPFTGNPIKADDIETIIDFNTTQISDFYNKILKGISC